MGFPSLAQTGVAGSAFSGLTVAATFASTPTPGNIILVRGTFFDGTTTPPTIGVDDGAGHSFTVDATTTGATNMAAAGLAWMAYLLVVPSGMGKTITATFNKATQASAIWLDEVTVSGGTAVVHSPATAGSGTGAITTPTITASVGDLLSIVATDQDSVTVCNSPWTENAGGNQFGNSAAYVLSASGDTAANYTGSSPTDAYNALGASFSISGGAAQVPYQPQYFQAPAGGY